MTSISVVAGLLIGAVSLVSSGTAIGQQVPDLRTIPAIVDPSFAPSSGPRVVIDEAHHNFHTAEGRYRPFAELLRRDGYRVEAANASFAESSLAEVGVLVISNPLHGSNVDNWRLPTPSAFTEAEIEAVKTWVSAGGSLLLILDHMPFPGAGDALARAFGFQFSNGFATRKGQAPATVVFDRNDGLCENEVTMGRGPSDRVGQVASFTGSAFRAPEGARPLLVFDERFESLEPAIAWQFDSNTGSIPLAGWCQGAVASFGSGRIAVFGEAAMFTAQVAGAGRVRVGMNTPEGAENSRLLLNVMRWLSANRPTVAK